MRWAAMRCVGRRTGALLERGEGLLPSLSERVPMPQSDAVCLREPTERSRRLQDRLRGASRGAGRRHHHSRGIAGGRCPLGQLEQHLRLIGAVHPYDHGRGRKTERLEGVGARHTLFDEHLRQRLGGFVLACIGLPQLDLLYPQHLLGLSHLGFDGKVLAVGPDKSRQPRLHHARIDRLGGIDQGIAHRDAAARSTPSAGVRHSPSWGD
jgi:hypothetical protein